MAERKGYGAALAGGLMMTAAVAVAVLGAAPDEGTGGEDGPPPQELRLVLDAPVPAVAVPADPRVDRADAEAALLDASQWGPPSPLPDLAGEWCITTATSASGKPARLDATETWTAGGNPQEYLRTGAVAVGFDGVDWARVTYAGSLRVTARDACISHAGSTWNPSDAAGRAERVEEFEFAELTMRQYYAGESFRTGACQPIVRLTGDVLTVQRGEGFAHWHRCG